MRNFWSIFALVLAIIGGINWLLIGIFAFNLVGWLFGFAPWIASLIYILVGLAAIYLFVWLIVGASRRRENVRQMS